MPILGAGLAVQAQTESVLQLAQIVALHGVSGGFDHFAYDPQRRQLFLAAEDHGTVEVIDPERGKRIESIAGFKNPHSIVIVPGASRFLVTDSGASHSSLVDTAILKRIRTLKLGLGANCSLFDVERKVVYVTAGGDRVGEKSSSLETVDPDTGDVLKSVQVDALHLQPMALDPRTDRLFVNLADQNAIGIYNRETLARIATWQIPIGSRNSPIVFDAQDRRLFVIASEPGILLEFDSDSGRLRSSIATSPNPDDMALDSATQRIFVPGDGVLAVFDASDSGHIELLQQVKTGKNARTGILFASGTKYAVAVPGEGHTAPHVLIFNVRR